jgi:glycosyltransferase involved in cell wall biosynthesis
MSRPLRVLYILHDSRRSGVPAVAANFIRLATTANIEPTVLFAYNGVYADDLRAEGVPVFTLGPRTALWWRAKRFLLNRFLVTRGKEFDVIHVHSLKLAWSVLIAKSLGLKVVFHLHELPRRIDWLLRKAISTADSVVYCSETCAAHYSGYRVRLGRTIVNGIEIPPSPAHRDPAGPLKVVMVASLNKNKGQDLLLKAFARLLRRDVELWLYGTTGLSAHTYVHELKTFAEQHQLTDRVVFPGPTAEVFKVFTEASVVVHTSWTESFGMALVEAQSCAVPVIAHDLEGMREVVRNGVTGYLVRPGDVEELALRLDELLADAALRTQMGEAGRAMVEERFDMKSRVPEYRRLYEEVIGR